MTTYPSLLSFFIYQQESSTHKEAETLGRKDNTSSNDRRRLQTEPCVLLFKAMHMENGNKIEEVDCFDPSLGTYSHIANRQVEGEILKKFKDGELTSGISTIMQEGAYFNHDERDLVINENKDLDFGGKYDQSRRKLAVTGTKTMLALRVIAPDSSTSSSEALISDSWYGTNGDPVNLKSQYAACSYDQLIMNPAETNEVFNGVYTVSITQHVNGVNNDIVRAAAESQGNVNLGNMRSQFDFVMICIPPGTSGNWIAYAYGNWYLSVVSLKIVILYCFILPSFLLICSIIELMSIPPHQYNDNWCNYVSGQMHEIGHNIGLGHSGELEIYDDQSGMVGLH